MSNAKLDYVHISTTPDPATARQWRWVPAQLVLAGGLCRLGFRLRWRLLSLALFAALAPPHVLQGQKAPGPGSFGRGSRAGHRRRRPREVASRLPPNSLRPARARAREQGRGRAPSGQWEHARADGLPCLSRMGRSQRVFCSGGARSGPERGVEEAWLAMHLQCSCRGSTVVGVAVC